MRMSVRNKDYYQFCYDENEVVSSNENSFDNEEEELETFENGEEDEKIEDEYSYNGDSGTNDHIDENDCFYDTDPFDEVSIDPTCYQEEEVSSPTSIESFKLDGFVIEIDESSNTININTSPQSNSDTCSTEFLAVPPYYDELSSSGISLDSSSPVSSQHSLSTEIDRLRNVNALFCDFNGYPYYRRNRFRRISGCSDGSSGTLVGKSTKSLESLKSRSSTPDRKSPISFFRNKTNISGAKSDIELSRISKSNKTKKSKETSMFRLKRSSSMSLKKRKHSKQRDSMDLLSPTRPVAVQEASSTELTLQQPSPFVRTIFQFVDEMDYDEMFPSSEDLTTIPMYSCNRTKLFQDLTKNNSLSRRHKHKNNLSQILRTVFQDNHDPILLSSGRRVCETADFIIAVIAYLDRIRKAQEIVEEVSNQPKQQRRHTIEASNTMTVDSDQLQPSSNRFERLSLRKKYLLPLTLHERFSPLSNDVVFDQDTMFTELFPRKMSRSTSNLLDPRDQSPNSTLNRSKSLRNMSFGSLRRKSKPKKSNKDLNSDTIPHTPHDKDKCDHEFQLDISTSSNEQMKISEKDKVLEQNILQTVEKQHSDCFDENMKIKNRSKQRENGDSTGQSSSSLTPHTQVNVCRNCSSILNTDPKLINCAEQTVKQQTGTIRLLAEKLKKINKRSKVPDVEYWTETNRDQQLDKMEKSKQNSEPKEGKMEGAEPTVSKKEETAIRKRSGNIRRSLSWRLKKDKIKNTETHEEAPKSKEKVNKFSSIRSIFEPLSPSEKKKFSVGSPNVRRRSSKSNKPERVVSLRYSKVDNDGEGRVTTPPSSPEANIRLDDSPGSTYTSPSASSDIYSSDSSAFDEQSIKKIYIKRTQESPPSRNNENDGRIIVDVPSHLIPSKFIRSPKSSPRTVRRNIASNNHLSPVTSPLTSTKPFRNFSPLELKQSTSAESSEQYSSPESLKKEINNNNLDRVEMAHSDRVSPTKNSPLSSTAPMVKPKPIRTSSIAIVRPKPTGSNVAMVSPIMKSDMNQPQQADIRRTSNSVASVATIKSIRRREPILEKWKNLEKSKEPVSSNTVSSSSLEKWKHLEKSKDPLGSATGSRTAPNTPKLPRRRATNNFRRYSESSDIDPPSEQADDAEKEKIKPTQAKTSSLSRKQSTDTDAKIDKKEELASIVQLTNEINKLSQNVDYIDKKKPVEQEKNDSTATKIENTGKSPKNIRATRSRSPTNAIIVRRKSYKNVSNHQGEANTKESNDDKNVDSLNEKKLEQSTTRAVDDKNLEPKKTMADICGLKMNTVSNTDDSQSTQDSPKGTMQRKTADGKPIGYATKIMGSPTLHHSSRRSSNSGNQPIDTPGSIIDDSPEKIQNDLDSYIKQSFMDIENTMRRNRARKESQPSTETEREQRRESRRRNRIGYKNRGRQENTVSSDGEEFNTPSPEEELRDRKISSTRSRLQTIKSEEEVTAISTSSSVSLSTIVKNKKETEATKAKTQQHPSIQLTKADAKLTDNTMDTMKEFEEFLRKQERKARREMKRLSRENSLTETESQENLVVKKEEVTVEQYKQKQEKLRRERKEFQEKHLRQRRLSLGSKWPSLGNIGATGKPLERKLSLPSILHHLDPPRGLSPSSTNSSNESLPDRPVSSEDVSNIGEGHQSASPKLGRRHSFSGLSHKQRCNSTGHSPDIEALLQHLICDIEEEIVVSSGDEDNGLHFKKQQLENFNSNLDMLKSQSEDSLNTTNSLPRGSSKGLIRQYCSENVIGLQAGKRVRRRTKRKSNVTSGDTSDLPYISGKVRQIEVCLLLDQEQKSKNAVKIETVPIQRICTYKDVENVVVESFIKHLQLLDKQSLDVGEDDIAYLQIAQRKISLGSVIDLSHIDVENGNLPCQLCLKGKNEWSLASLAYDTLVPRTYLEKYVSLILTHRQVIFYGPSGTGKSYVARRIASLVTHRMNNNKIPTLVYKNMSAIQWKELLEIVASDKKTDPYVILIDGFAENFIKSERDITEIITVSESIHPQPYIICTVTQSSHYDIPTPWQKSFKWIWLPNHEEPIDGILQRFLRRKYTQHCNEMLKEAFRIADWLAATWRHINEVLEKFNSTECTIGPTMFYTCPADIASAEEWFIDLWNYSITPYFLHAIKCGIKLYGQRHEWVDPLESILNTYPWNDTEGGGRKAKLRRIRPEDVGYQTSVSSTQPQVDSEAEKERLLEFLRQLELLMHDGGLGELPNFEKTFRYESDI